MTDAIKRDGYTVEELLAMPGCLDVTLVGPDGSGVVARRPPGKWVARLMRPEERCRHGVRAVERLSDTHEKYTNCIDCMVHGPDMVWKADSA